MLIITMVDFPSDYTMPQGCSVTAVLSSDKYISVSIQIKRNTMGLTILLLIWNIMKIQFRAMKSVNMSAASYFVYLEENL